jgi:hypothetical protein
VPPTLTCVGVLLCLHDDTMGAHMGVERTNTVKVRFATGLACTVTCAVRACVPILRQETVARWQSPDISVARSPLALTCDLIASCHPPAADTTRSGLWWVWARADLRQATRHIRPFDILVRTSSACRSATAIISDATRFTSGLWQGH